MATHVERLLALEQFGIKLGLDAMRVLLRALGNPHERYPSVHVAGTNGKGSVTAMVDIALRAAGWRSGRYTSPHLARLEERVAVDGVDIEPATLDDCLGRVFAAVDGLVAHGDLAASPTFFEVSTAAAFLAFANAAVDVAVIEVGLGGRYDATNVILPVVGAITSIALDHQRHLGSTLAAIAGEKAGIAKPGVSLVVGRVPEEAWTVIVAAAAAAGARVVPAADTLALEVGDAGGHAVLRLATPAHAYPEVRLGLAGRHQVDNALVAVAVLEVLDATTPLAVGPEAVVAGLRDVRWPARLEWLRHPETGARVLVDAAHNPAGARALASYLEEAAVREVSLVTSVMRDKDIGGVLRPLVAHAGRVIATRADSPRACDAGELAAAIARLGAGARDVTAIDDPWDAVQAALRYTAPVVIAGSIFLAGPLRAALVARGGFRSA